MMNGNMETTKQAEQSRSTNNETTGTATNVLEAPERQHASQKRQERRIQRRTAAKLLVRLRPADSRDPNFEEVLGTLNASRANLYVITASRSYYKWMRLRITFPFDSAHDSVSAPENPAEVVRLDHLPDGRTGVAVLIRQSGQATVRLTPTQSHSAGQAKGERRSTVRHAFTADATAIEKDSRIRLQARCSDLSVAGCYIDTINPFPRGATVYLQLTNNKGTFETPARVITHHVGMGMGLIFDGPGPDQASVLVNWLSNHSTTPLPAMELFGASEPPTTSEMSGSSDRALIRKLLQLLESNAKQTPI